MAITIAANIAALRAARQLAIATDSLTATTERLASGMRINRASDDPAGLSLAAALENQQRLACIAIRNSNDALSLLTLEDSALSEISNVLQRMAELAEQAGNGVITNTQRSVIQAEFSALGSEIERIASSTKFNKIQLLSAAQDITIQVGFKADSLSQIKLQAADANLQAIRLANSGSSVMTYSVMAAGGSQLDSQAAAKTALAAVREAIDTVGSKRGMLGASESRLHTAINNLESIRETAATAESRIRDADLAQETANLVRQQILQQAAAAVMAQANLQQNRVLTRLLNN